MSRRNSKEILAKLYKFLIPINYWGDQAMEIFKNKQVLDIEYIPTEEMLLFREKEQEQLRRVFKNISSVPNHLVWSQ